jgi:hypothetical protein
MGTLGESRRRVIGVSGSVQRDGCESFPLSRNVRVPDGVPDPGALAETAAVNVTACLMLAGSAEEVSVSVVVSLLTIWLSAVEELPLKLVSPG